MRMTKLLCAALLMSAATVNTASAFEQGDWLARFGASYVDPKSNNHEIVSVDGAASLTFNFAYMMTENISFELLAAWPFKHDIDLVGGPKVATTKHLPPTFSINYHFMTDSKFQPYIGVGLNYTTFFDEDTKGALEGVDLSLGSSWGVAGQIGADIMLNDTWFINLNARYINIDTRAELDGVSIGTVDINPWVWGGHVGLRF